MTEKLDEIRKRIDSIDDQVHDLLMERASLVSGIAAEKKKNKMPTVQPAREAKMIRRLLARHKGPLPEATIVQIWRELVGAVSLLQTGLSVVVTADQHASPYWDMARNYFGSVLPMRRISDPLAAIGAVRDNTASFAVLPWPEDTDQSPWWSHMLSSEGERMRIICRLPYGSDESRPATRALVISKMDFKESGEDSSFITLELDPTVSRAFIVETFNKLGLSPLGLYTSRGALRNGFTLHLVEIGSFVDDESPVLAKIREAFGASCAYCVALGGYPAVPVYKKLSIQNTSQIPVAPTKKKGSKKKTAKA